MLLLLVLNAASSPLKTFGTGRSAFVLTTNETTVFSHTVSPGATHAVLTHFWTTAFTHAAADNATVRYYVDGESQPSIEFKPSMAAGAGFDDQACLASLRWVMHPRWADGAIISRCHSGPLSGSRCSSL